ncbi:hypothetical protein Pyn_09469 [Prunus yedoensis var. nudiflora]|uniref:Uncharacterized protein n=1 Tax=Prunus yedoensis var. nudiflora TaxID=2094558 RepID=A0A314UEP7_PRUYE|nr:hypothetical protein Pyn_09469 [Prunus yedoensis var. nudiflora]
MVVVFGFGMAKAWVFLGVPPGCLRSGCLPPAVSPLPFIGLGSSLLYARMLLRHRGGRACYSGYAPLSPS